MRLCPLGLLLLAPITSPLWAGPGIVSETRAAVARHELDRAESQIRAYRARFGVTAEVVEALSWLGRGAFAASSLDRAEAYATEARELALELLKKRSLDAEPHLPLALGAAIELQAQVMAARGERAEAVSFLRRELRAYGKTSIRTRLQKNLNILSLEGKPAPPLDVTHWLGPRPESLDRMKGRPILLFFWAHWCSDCKDEAPILAELLAEFERKGLILVGPTRCYGYGAGGLDVTPEQELRYIDEVRKRYYAALSGMPVPVSEANFKVYGASTTPTIVLIDRRGTVRLYHPGAMSYEALSARIKMLLLD